MAAESVVSINNNNNNNNHNSNNNQNNMNKPLCFVGTTTAAVSVVSMASSSRMRQCAAWKLLNRIWKTSPVDRVRVRLTANNAYMMTFNDKDDYVDDEGYDDIDLYKMPTRCMSVTK